jgi:hypothetical protein
MKFRAVHLAPFALMVRLVGVGLALLASAPAWSQAPPVALVIGQNDYRNMSRLDNAVNDARLIASNLQSRGYAAVVPNWTALFAPAGTDPAIIRHLSQALQRVLADPAFVSELRGFWALPVTPDKGIPLEVNLSLKVGLEVTR